MWGMKGLFEGERVVMMKSCRFGICVEASEMRT